MPNFYVRRAFSFVGCQEVKFTNLVMILGSSICAPATYRSSLTNVATLQLKSSLLLHVDGTSGTAEDIGRQVRSCFKFKP